MQVQDFVRATFLTLAFDDEVTVRQRLSAGLRTSLGAGLLSLISLTVSKLWAEVISPKRAASTDPLV